MVKSVRADAPKSKAHEHDERPDLSDVLGVALSQVFALAEAGGRTFTAEQRKAARDVAMMLQATILLTPTKGGIEAIEAVARTVTPERREGFERAVRETVNPSADRWTCLERAANDLTGASSSDARIQAIAREAERAHDVGTPERLAWRLPAARFESKPCEDVARLVGRMKAGTKGGKGNPGLAAVVSELTGLDRKADGAALSRRRQAGSRPSRAKP